MGRFACTAGMALLLVLSCNRGSGAGSRVPGKSVETEEPEASDQKPAFPNQTRAPFRTTSTGFELRRVTGELDHPWGLAFLPDGRFLVTERAGRLRIVSPGGEKTGPVAGLPELDVGDQGGLLDVALDPRFHENRLVYLSYSEPRDGGNGTAVARGKLDAGNAPRLESVQVIWRMTPTLDSGKHFGGRLVFSGDDALFITTGERSISAGRPQAQRLDGTLGKVVRIRPDGSVPGDNPFVGKAGARPEIYSYGHRNIQAAALHPRTRELWTVEHGARGGDEINRIEPGKNYGWPAISYGIEYLGTRIGEGKTAAPGMEQPVYYWDPVIAPSGMAFYTGSAFPEWQGSLFVGALKGRHVARLTLEGNRVVGEERLFAGRVRYRDVRVGPDGYLYLLTDESDGELLEVVPAKGG